MDFIAGAAETGRAPDAPEASDLSAAGWRLEFEFPLHSLEVGAHVASVLITRLAIFLQRLVDDVIKFWWKIRIQAHRGNWVAL